MSNIILGDYYVCAQAFQSRIYIASAIYAIGTVTLDTLISQGGSSQLQIDDALLPDTSSSPLSHLSGNWDPDANYPWLATGVVFQFTINGVPVPNRTFTMAAVNPGYFRTDDQGTNWIFAVDLSIDEQVALSINPGFTDIAQLTPGSAATTSNVVLTGPLPLPVQQPKEPYTQRTA